MATEAEAKMAIRLGADALGLVGVAPPTPRVVSDDVAAEIARTTPPPVATFLLTSETTGEGIAERSHRIRPTAIQVVKPIDPSEYVRLSELLPRDRMKRVQVVHVEGVQALDMIERYAPHVDAFLLDSGRPGAADFGGTGRTHDWAISADFVSRSPLPVFLAGGLAPDNVGRAIGAVQPFGIDVCTGVRTMGLLDEAKLSAFLEAIRAADALRA
jgi:phosphoribosylanthranilate isomerase